MSKINFEKAKIVALRVHEPVILDRTLISTFSAVGSRGKYNADMSFVPEMNAVLIESATDKALVPMVNIAYVKLDSDSFQKAEEAAKKEKAKKSSVKPQDIKRPR